MLPTDISFVNFDFLYVCVDYFRPLIRALLSFWLLVFNLNQILILFGGSPLSLGSFSPLDTSTGISDREYEDFKFKNYGHRVK